ncbi:hypothetical protein GCM10020001_081760 [Nonomuraea salmonea]
MQHVADDGDLAALEIAEAAAHGEGVEQRLGGVLVGAVAGVDDAAVHPVGQAVRRAGRAVADDDRVGAHGLEGERGVLERLALGHAGALGREVDHVGRQPLGGRLEGDPGAGGVLEEQVDDRAPAQRGQLLDGTFRDARQLLGGVEDEQRVVLGQVSGGDEVPLHRAPSFMSRTASRPSVSCR